MYSLEYGIQDRKKSAYPKTHGLLAKQDGQRHLLLFRTVKKSEGDEGRRWDTGGRFQGSRRQINTAEERQSDTAASHEASHVWRNCE